MELGNLSAADVVQQQAVTVRMVAQAQERATLRRTKGGKESVRLSVVDGDSVNVNLLADGALARSRLVTVDTPETKYKLPPSLGGPNRAFRALSDAKWTTFLTGATNVNLHGLIDGHTAADAFGAGLLARFISRLGATCAANHLAHGQRAHRHLEALVQQDVTARAGQGRPYGFMLDFAVERVDRFNRLLCFLSCDDTGVPPGQALGGVSYNEKMLRSGMAIPYFIWPNVDPNVPRAPGPLRAAAVPPPGQLQAWLANNQTLQALRNAAQAARQALSGIYAGFTDAQGNSHAALQLLPYELRLLADRRAPQRHVLDLSKIGTPAALNLLHPCDYFRIPNLEDRLFIDAADLPAFVAQGYVLQPRQ
jgi:endonuclease YncB( thermonuclease family)